MDAKTLVLILVPFAFLTAGIACAVLALLGLVVAPRLFGVVFLFLPFIWIGRFRRRLRR